MNRRDFIASAGAGAGTLAALSPLAASATPRALRRAEFETVETAIRGSFGARFRTRSAKRAGGQIVALIEHNGNILEVATADLTDWTVLRATDM